MQTIDIKTTQNVTIEYELASLRDRIFAMFIDLMIVGVIYLIILLSVLSVFGDFFIEQSLLGTFLFFFFPLGLFLSYQLFSEVLANGQSWGKKAIGLKVVRLDGKEPGLSDYLLRSIFHIIDTFASGGVIAALLVSSSVKKQRLGDLTAGTTVIRVKLSLRFQLEDILKINTLEDYEPTYPEVRRLREEDMLLIKSIISRYRKYKNPAHRDVVNELVSNLEERLDISERPPDKIEFLKILIRDYIVLTR